MTDKLIEIYNAEQNMHQLRAKADKEREALLVKYREEAQREISRMRKQVDAEKDEHVKNVNQEVANAKSLIDAQRNKNLELLRAQFEMRKDGVKKQVRDEVFDNGNR